MLTLARKHKGGEKFMSVQQLSAAICEDDPVYLELLQKEILQIIPVSIQKFSSYQDGFGIF